MSTLNGRQGSPTSDYGTKHDRDNNNNSNNGTEREGGEIESKSEHSQSGINVSLSPLFQSSNNNGNSSAAANNNKAHNNRNNNFSIDDDDHGSIGSSNNLNHHSLPSPNEVTRDKNDLFETIAGVAGNVLEWYDFAVFGYFGDVIGEVFFPPQEGHAAIVESFAVFGGAFLMRPIGGMMMGYIGDTYGRKKALEISIFLMAFPTFTMGLLPSYERVGIAAPILLTIVRLLQGLSVGGQLMSSLVFTVEKHPKEKWGLYGSYVMAAANVGTLLGGIIGYVMRRYLNYDQLLAWGWRVPFLAGILVSFSGVYLKFHCPEDELFHNLPDGATPENPILLSFRKENLRSLLSSALVPMAWSGGFYISFVWMSIYMTDLIENPVPNAFAVNALSLLCSVVIVFPFAGILSDRFGRTIIMRTGGILMVLFAPPLVYIIGQHGAENPFLAAFVPQTLLGLILTLWGAPMCAWLAESFRPELRLTAVSIGYNCAQAIVGGTCPAVATLMVDTYGSKSPGFLLSVITSFSLIGLWIAPAQSGTHDVLGTNTDQFNIAFDDFSDDEDEDETMEMNKTRNGNLDDKQII